MQLDEDSPEMQIIAYCNDPPPEQIISPRVVRLSRSTVIKLGFDVKATEAENQK